MLTESEVQRFFFFNNSAFGSGYVNINHGPKFRSLCLNFGSILDPLEDK